MIIQTRCQLARGNQRIKHSDRGAGGAVRQISDVKGALVSLNDNE